MNVDQTAASLPTVGIVGGGQLARMLLPPAARLTLPIRLLADAADPACEFVPSVLPGRPDAEGLRRLAEACDVLTVEHELVDLHALAALEHEGRVIRPSSTTLHATADKAHQRRVLSEHGIPLAPWTVTDQLADLRTFADAHGWPLVIKPPRGGYDGRGVFVVPDLDEARALLDGIGGPVLVEPHLAIDQELAVLIARRPGGETVAYPPVQTVQVDGMCQEVILPAPVPRQVAAEATMIAERVAKTIGAVGILAVELFLIDGRVLLNELAARPHNAGHVTIEGSVTSQFENHLRAIADLPLGSTETRTPAAMVNVVGTEGDPRDNLAAALALDDVAVHLYGKEARPGRKLGHVTATADAPERALERAREAAAILMRSPQR
jgi:5-(carboxyamino)imidazole ribonucleotide synthase